MGSGDKLWQQGFQLVHIDEMKMENEPRNTAESTGKLPPTPIDQTAVSEQRVV